MERGRRNIPVTRDRVPDTEISDSEIRNILKRIGVKCEISSIRMIVLENDLKLKKSFIRVNEESILY